MQPQDPYNPVPGQVPGPVPQPQQPQQAQQPINPTMPTMADLPPATTITDLPDAALPEVDMPYTEAPVPATIPGQHPYDTPPQPVAPPSMPPPQTPPVAYVQPAPVPQQPVGTPQPPAQNHVPPVGDQGRSHLSHVGKKYFDLIEFDDQEVLLAEIRKHSFGLFIIFLTGGLIAFTLFAAVAALAGSGFLSTLGFGNINSLVVFAGFLLSIFVIVITLINAHLYRNNVVFVTNEKLAQVLFITLFNRKISQLSIGDVQDVTVQQNGFLPNMIGYGTLVVETAGEQQNYTFSFVPKPYETSKIIINAHESNLKQYGN